jgi:UDP:flavonoid glycosyltransferase YjiC (YdhE family)
VYTQADYTLYADVPELTPTFALPAHHHYLGPVLWSPEVPLPDWWDRLPSGVPLVYVTLGSSGASALLSTVLEALADRPVLVMAATAGRINPGHIPANARVAAYLPGTEAAARASLVICNGGSPTTHQALAAGAPVLGLPSNLDQHLNMADVCRAGAGKILRPSQATTATLRTAVERILLEPGYQSAAQKLATTFARYDAKARFRRFVDQTVGSGRGEGLGRGPIGAQPDLVHGG